MITCNHIHLLIKDNEANHVSKGMALAAGCMGREYNRHNNRRGAFWEDHYQLSLIEIEDYLFRCFIYIDSIWCELSSSPPNRMAALWFL